MLAAKTEARRQAIQMANDWLAEKPVYLDTETTGLGNRDQIVEIAIIDFDGTLLINELVRPAIPIPPDATRIHGITNSMVAGAMSFPILWATKIRPVLFGRLVAIYNSEFDLRMIRQSNGGVPVPVSSLRTVDLLDLYAKFYGEWDPARRGYRYQSLEKAGRQCDIPLPNAHRALADTLLTRALLHYMAAATI